MSEAQPISHSPLEIVRNADHLRSDPTVNVLLDVFETNIDPNTVSGGLTEAGGFRLSGLSPEIGAITPKLDVSLLPETGFLFIVNQKDSEYEDAYIQVGASPWKIGKVGSRIAPKDYSNWLMSMFIKLGDLVKDKQRTSIEDTMLRITDGKTKVAPQLHDKSLTTISDSDSTTGKTDKTESSVPESQSPLEKVRSVDYVKRDPGCQALLRIFEQDIRPESISGGLNEHEGFRLQGVAKNSPSKQSNAIVTAYFDGVGYTYSICSDSAKRQQSDVFYRKKSEWSVGSIIEDNLLLGEESRAWLTGRMHEVSEAFKYVTWESIRETRRHL